MQNRRVSCELCGLPMPEGEQMFKYHGYSGPCPEVPKPQPPCAHDKFKLTSTREGLVKCDRCDSLRWLEEPQPPASRSEMKRLNALNGRPISQGVYDVKAPTADEAFRAEFNEWCRDPGLQIQMSSSSNYFATIEGANWGRDYGKRESGVCIEGTDNCKMCRTTQQVAKARIAELESELAKLKGDKS